MPVIPKFGGNEWQDMEEHYPDIFGTKLLADIINRLQCIVRAVDCYKHLSHLHSFFCDIFIILTQNEFYIRTGFITEYHSKYSSTRGQVGNHRPGVFLHSGSVQCRLYEESLLLNTVQR